VGRTAALLATAALVGGCTAVPATVPSPTSPAPTSPAPTSPAPASPGTPPGLWDERPVVELGFEVSDDLRRVAGREAVTFTPDAKACELVFRAWPNKPETSADGTSLVVTDVLVEGAPAEPVVTAAGAPPGAPGTMVEVPLPECVEPGTQVSAELGFTLTLGEDADARVGVVPDAQVAWFATAFPLLAWVRGEGWVRDDAVDLAGETVTSEAFELAELSVSAPDGYAVLGTGSAVDAVPAERPGRTVHRFAAEAVRDVAVAVGRYEVAEREVDGVRIRVAVPAAGSRVGAREWIDAHAEAIPRLEELFGPFPYRDLWVSITPTEITGLEFPTSLFYGDLDRDEIAELVAHELAHQWTYALVGNNQARDPWLDEAFATFGEAVVTGMEDDYALDDIPGQVVGHLGYPMSYWAGEGGFARYYEGVYRQGAAVLLAAREGVGSTAFDEALRGYVADNADRVARPEDVEAAFAHLPEAVELLREYGAFSGPG
jgi:hypothetical protein